VTRTKLTLVSLAHFITIYYLATPYQWSINDIILIFTLSKSAYRKLSNDFFKTCSLLYDKCIHPILRWPKLVNIELSLKQNWNIINVFTLAHQPPSFAFFELTLVYYFAFCHLSLPTFSIYNQFDLHFIE